MNASGKARIGFVVIGRNEGDNLRNCLESLSGTDAKKVYVDSGSVDDSVKAAEPLCDLVLPLDPGRPFSAARARNEGFEALMRISPETEYVQFLDGDCTLIPGWIEGAAEALARREAVAVAVGHLIERFPDRSPYNRLCDLEWRSPPGDIVNYGALGGIMMVRAAAFRALGGFNTQVIAGEDSEFGVRLALNGHVVTKLDLQMATHDANILRFAQWWRRSVRAGHAIGQRSYLNGKSSSRDCVRELRSTLAWGIAWPLLALSSALFSPWLPPVFLAAYALLYSKILAFRVGRGDSRSEARLYAAFTVIAKVANGVGFVLFLANRLRGEYRIIEYK
jgi:GT2 family glycosyltransferase